jgi:hypothetical protein
MSKIEWTKGPFFFVGLDEFGNLVFVIDKKNVTSGKKSKPKPKSKINHKQ